MSKRKCSEAYELRCVCQKKGIFVDLCRFVPEMLNKINSKTVAILIDTDLQQGLKRNQLYNNDVKKMIYFFDNGKIYNNQGLLVCESFEQFVNLDIFNCPKQTDDVKMLINQTFAKLDIKANKWQVRLIKEILHTMHKNDVKKSSPELVNKIIGQIENKPKDTSYLLRYYIREIYQKVYAYKGLNLKCCYMYKVIDMLYDITFNKAEQN